MAKVFVATVMIAFEADTVSEACDSVSAMMTETLGEQGAIIDWIHAPHNCIYPDPVCIGDVDLTKWEPGDFFTIKKNTNG